VVAAFKKRKQARPSSKLDSSTLRGFGGGWNAIDDDLSMQPNYQVSLVNFHRQSSGGQAVRFGSNFNCDIKAVRNSPIVDGYYFNGRNIIVTQSGNILTTTLDGTIITEIWNTAIAAALPGAPIAWRTGVTQVSFVPFKDTLIIHDGKDKPVVIDSNFVVKYLQDLGTGSNVNVPIGKFGCVAANYHIVANTVVTDTGGNITTRNPTYIYISGKGTSGTFYGDPTTDALPAIDVGAYAPEGAAAIRGIAGFRNYLLVFMQNITLQIKLGKYNDATPPIHTPEFPDNLPQFGVLGNRCIATVENDIMFCGLNGLASAKRNLYAPDSFTSDFLSTQIAPAYRQIVGALTDDQQMNKAFSAYDKLNNDYLLFMPNGKVLCYTFNPRLKMHAWSEFENMDWAAAWTSVLGRLFLAQGTKVFLSGNGTFGGENFYADRMLDRDYVWINADAGAMSAGGLVYDSITGEVWKCMTTHAKVAGITFAQERDNNSTMWQLYEGNPIPIDFELPWIDGKDPMKLKQLRYVSIATKGDAEFTFDVFVDNLYKDVDGNVIYSPGISMAFVGNDAYGYGFDDVNIDPTTLNETGYGMGRRSRDPRLFGMPIKFKTVKFRIHGQIAKKLEIINLSFLYARNKVRGYVR
jgi:hypothetical protein